MDELYDIEVGGFNLFGLLLAFCLIALFLFVLYWLWDCTWRQSDEVEIGAHHQILMDPVLPRPVVPLYAFELEPGTVVLQSADGEIFRILREYDSVGRTGRGCPPLYESIATTPTTSEFHYVPSYTRAHFQTRPSAPQSEGSGARPFSPTPSAASGDDPFGDEGPWTPLAIRSYSR